MLVADARSPVSLHCTLVPILCAVIVASLPNPVRADPLRDCEQLDNLPLAIRACSRLITDIPGSAALHNRRGIAHFRNGEIDRAIADYAEAIRLDARDTDAYYNRGRALLEKNAYTEALLDFGQAIARNPKHPLAHNGRAWALLKLGNLADALDAANQAIASDSKYAPAYDTRAHIYEALGKREQAIADFRQALALDPANPLVQITREGLRRLGAAP
jgi:tetratricopeptide (TPR) repeat protein